MFFPIFILIIRSEINERDLVYYKMKYAQIKKTKQKIVSDINYKNNSRFKATSFYSIV